MADKTDQLSGESCLQFSEVLKIYLIGLAVAVALSVGPSIRAIRQLRTLRVQSLTGKRMLRRALRDIRRMPLYRNRFIGELAVSRRPSTKDNSTAKVLDTAPTSTFAGTTGRQLSGATPQCNSQSPGDSSSFDTASTAAAAAASINGVDSIQQSQTPDRREAP